MTYRRVKDPKEVVVIFKTHLRAGADQDAYRRTSRRMHELVTRVPGFLSIRAYAGEDGEIIDIARFADEESLQVWREDPEHREAQLRGREEFYDLFWVQVCRVMREYEFRFAASEPTTMKSPQRRGRRTSGARSGRSPPREGGRSGPQSPPAKLD